MRILKTGASALVVLTLAGCSLIGIGGGPSLPPNELGVILDVNSATIQCGTVAWRTANQIDSCRWSNLLGSTSAAAPDGFTSTVTFNGNPNDSILVTARAHSIRRGLLSTTAKTRTFWLKLADVAPGAPDTLIINMNEDEDESFTSFLDVSNLFLVGSTNR